MLAKDASSEFIIAGFGSPARIQLISPGVPDQVAVALSRTSGLSVGTGDFDEQDHALRSDRAASLATLWCERLLGARRG